MFQHFEKLQITQENRYMNYPYKVSYRQLVKYYDIVYTYTR